jgi:hypothetical protein
VTESNSSLAGLHHAWRYFALHANQRMSVFNFFLVLSGLVSAGLATIIQGPQRLAAIGIALGILLALVSLVFWKLDQRVSFLLKLSESALAELESSLPAGSRLFANEPSLTDKECAERGMWTYGHSFRLTFLSVGIFGLSGSILSALKVFGLITW